MGASARHRFKGMAVAVSALEVHARVHAGGVLAKNMLHEAGVLEEAVPVVGIQKANRGDRIGDGDLIGRLLLLLLVRHEVNGNAESVEFTAEPGLD